MCILALADDMTGALEVGAKFSAAGMRSLVSARAGPSGDAPVVVFDTETRHCAPRVAYTEVRRFLEGSGIAHPRLIYKKTDSTLRGNISTELLALADEFPSWRIGYAPAYPSLGRTVKNGVLYVDGVPVAETVFGHDALNPIRSSTVASILGSGLSCVVFDGVTDSDLASAARTILSDESIRIAAGPAGLAEAIARLSARPGFAPSFPHVGSCLVLNGSLHPDAAAQIQYAAARDVLTADRTAWSLLARSFPDGTDPAEAAKENGRLALTKIEETDPDAVFVIGGDTAFAVITELGLPTIAPIGEVVPGIPVSRIESEQIARILPRRKRDLLLITKAGGFGAIDALCRTRTLLDTNYVRDHNR